MFIKIEADASKNSFINYCIVCFNGRFGWLPYIEHLNELKNESGVELIELDFDDIAYEYLIENLLDNKMDGPISLSFMKYNSCRKFKDLTNT